MYQKCLLLIQCRIVSDSSLLRKKWNDLLRTKPLQLSNRLQVLLVDAEISGHCNIHLLVSFKSFLWLSRDLKVNLFGLQQDTE